MIWTLKFARRDVCSFKPYIKKKRIKFKKKSNINKTQPTINY